jgi:methionine-rich copper-binding protein CopC
MPGIHAPHWWNRLPVVLVTVLAFSLGFVPLATAHAELVSSDPRDGAVLTTPPAAVVARYSEAIDPGRSSILVLDATGRQVARGGVDPSDATRRTMRVSLPALAPGTYTVRWTTVTPDDNGVERGTFTFTVAAGGATASPSASPSGSTAAASASPVAATPSATTPAIPSAGAGESPASPAASPLSTSGTAATTSGDLLLPILAAVIVVVLLAGGLSLRRRQS